MRLVDLVAQSHIPSVVSTRMGRSYPVYGAADLAPLLTRCAIRYVLTDELARLSAELAYSTEDELTKCLDLVRLPAESLWIEWNESAELAGCHEFFDQIPLDVSEVGARAGIHILSSSAGRRAELRFVWSEGGQALVSPFKATIDLQDDPFRQCPLGDLMRGGWTSVSDSRAAVAELLGVARFCLEPTWAACYRATVRSPADRLSIRQSLGGPARTIPFLIAFLLLLSSREGIAVRPVAWDTLNRKRVRSGKQPLLCHVEASLALSLRIDRVTTGKDTLDPSRLAPRRHQVRGHLVRRSNRVFWRRPHVRGSVLRGQVMSRTVTLSFENSNG